MSEYREDTQLVGMAESALYDTERWFPKTRNLPFMGLALAGEVGEVCNLLKKVERGTHTLDEIRAELKEEVVDVFTYLLNIAAMLNLDLEEGYETKRTKNGKRFGNV